MVRIAPAGQCSPALPAYPVLQVIATAVSPLASPIPGRSAGKVKRMINLVFRERE